MKYLFDTSVLLIWLRDGTARQHLIRRFDPFGLGNYPVLSVVSVGEILSISIQNGWGEKRITQLAETLSRFVITSINQQDLLNRYAEIDAFSQGRLPGHPLGLTARNMGKNDLWIAATASITEANLLTTDRDFIHLNGIYLNCIMLEPKDLT